MKREFIEIIDTWYLKNKEKVINGNFGLCKEDLKSQVFKLLEEEERRFNDAIKTSQQLVNKFHQISNLLSKKHIEINDGINTIIASIYE